jgi:hypothetical protein
VGSQQHGLGHHLFGADQHGELRPRRRGHLPHLVKEPHVTGAVLDANHVGEVERSANGFQFEADVGVTGNVVEEQRQRQFGGEALDVLDQLRLSGPEIVGRRHDHGTRSGVNGLLCRLQRLDE